MGGRSSRKAQGRKRDFSSEESCFLERAVNVIIRRAAEVAYDPNARIPRNYDVRPSSTLASCSHRLVAQ